MVKSIKLTPRTAHEIGDEERDKDVYLWRLEGYTLETPFVWFQRTYSLKMFVLGGCDERDGLNPEAAAILHRLHDAGDGVARNRYSHVPVYGTVIICNGNEDDREDFTLWSIRSMITDLFVF